MGRTISQAVRELCLALPETTESTRFGDPIFRAGKKGFALYERCSERAAKGLFDRIPFFPKKENRV